MQRRETNHRHKSEKYAKNLPKDNLSETQNMQDETNIEDEPTPQTTSARTYKARYLDCRNCELPQAATNMARHLRTCKGGRVYRQRDGEYLDKTRQTVTTMEESQRCALKTLRGRGVCKYFGLDKNNGLLFRLSGVKRKSEP